MGVYLLHLSSICLEQDCCLDTRQLAFQVILYGCQGGQICLGCQSLCECDSIHLQIGVSKGAQHTQGYFCLSQHSLGQVHHKDGLHRRMAWPHAMNAGLQSIPCCGVVHPWCLHQPWMPKQPRCPLLPLCCLPQLVPAIKKASTTMDQNRRIWRNTQ